MPLARPLMQELAEIDEHLKDVPEGWDRLTACDACTAEGVRNERRNCRYRDASNIHRALAFKRAGDLRHRRGIIAQNRTKGESRRDAERDSHVLIAVTIVARGKTVERSTSHIPPEIISVFRLLSRVQQNPGRVHLLGIESPGMTAAPAIAEYVSRLI